MAEDLRPYTLDAMAGQEIYTNRATLKAAQRRVQSCRIAFTTCIGAGIGLLRSQTFEVVIVDEASQQTEPASLVPLVKGCRRAILVGDHVQLRPTVPQVAALDFDVSLFERLYTTSQAASGADATTPVSPAVVASRLMLDTQYRMHPAICRFSSDEFYGGKLRTGVHSDARPLPASVFPWPGSTTSSSGAATKGDVAKALFVECSARENQFGQKSKSNEGQAELCVQICKLLLTAAAEDGNNSDNKPKPDSSKSQTSVAGQSIAILTPYTKQLEILKKKLAAFSSSSNVEVSTIDGYQGREADIVVFVTTRCNASCEIGFLKDLRRMNVALTRARAGLLVLGNRETLTLGTADPESAAMWRRLLRSLVEVKVDVE